MKVSKLAANLIGSEIIKIGNQVNDMKSQGAEIANLTIGDLNSNIYPIPDLLKEEVQKAYQNNLTNYPPANGLLSLRKAISTDIKNRWNLDYSENDILVAGGSRPLIYAAFKTIVDPDDKVIYPVPSWNNNHYAYLTEAQKIEVETTQENNFLPTPRIYFLTPKPGVRTLFICNRNIIKSNLRTFYGANNSKFSKRRILRNKFCRSLY